MIKLTSFLDIPQFPTINYSVDIGFDYLPAFIDDQRKNNEYFELNPDFQRGHVWNSDQQTSWLEFVLRGGTSGKDIYFNHPGWMQGFDGKMVCVDGLQRVTAVLAFINNEVTAFGSYRREFTDRMRVTSHTLRVHVAVLQTRAEVLQWYIDLNSGGTDHTPEEIERVKELMTNDPQ